VYPERTTGAGVIVAVPGMTLKDITDRVPMTVLDTIISGYQMPGGWLHEELRGRQLVYVVHAINQPALVSGAFIAYAECACENATPVATTIADDFHKAVTYPFTQAQIDEAVNSIVTADLLGNQEMHSLAMQAALDELYGFGYDFRDKYLQMLRQVKPADVTRVARKYLVGPFVMVFTSAKPELVEKGRCMTSCQTCVGANP
jgi:predicted Zn-dependent peptidase